MLCDLCLRETGSDSGLHADCFKYLLQKQMEGCCVCHDLTRGGCIQCQCDFKWYHPDCYAQKQAQAAAGFRTKSATKKV